MHLFLHGRFNKAKSSDGSSSDGRYGDVPKINCIHRILKKTFKIIGLYLLLLYQFQTGEMYVIK